MTKDFYIFRHGQSTYNVLGRTQGQTNDSILTDDGRKQAIEVGKKLQRRGINIIVSSPLFRAKQTAELVNQSLHVPIVYDEHFIEVNVGVVEGLHYTEIQKKFPEIFTKLHSPNCEEYMDICYPQGETKRQVQERIWQGLNNWCEDPHDYRVIAISSHGIALSQILNALNYQVDDIKNGAILHLKEEDKKWSIVEMI